MTKINSLDDIVQNGLCIGCGICKSIAGNSLQMEMNDKGNLEPKELTPISNETLEEIKKNKDLRHLSLIKQSRLSVMPIDSKSWKILNKMSKI